MFPSPRAATRSAVFHSFERPSRTTCSVWPGKQQRALEVISSTLLVRYSYTDTFLSATVRVSAFHTAEFAVATICRRNLASYLLSLSAAPWCDSLVNVALLFCVAAVKRVVEAAVS